MIKDEYHIKCSIQMLLHIISIFQAKSNNYTFTQIPMKDIIKVRDFTHTKKVNVTVHNYSSI